MAIARMLYTLGVALALQVVWSQQVAAQGQSAMAPALANPGALRAFTREDMRAALQAYRDQAKLERPVGLRELREKPSDVTQVRLFVPFQVVPPGDLEPSWREMLHTIPVDLDDDMERAATHPCTKAAKEWDEAMWRLGERLENLELLPAETLRRYRATAADYDAKCLTRLAELTAEAAGKDITRLTAVLFFKGVPFCGALRLSDQTFATARHCFYDKDRGFARHFLDPSGAPAPANTMLRLVADPLRNYQVLEEIPLTELPAFGSSGRILHREDYTFLRVEPIALPMPAVSAQPVRDGEPLVVLGYYHFHQPQLVLSSAKLPPADEPKLDWIDGMRWSNAPLCRLIARRNDCIFHGCQAISGYSGTPVFVRNSDPGIRIAGLHVAGARTEGGCNSSETNNVGNVAVAHNLARASRPLP